VIEPPEQRSGKFIACYIGKHMRTGEGQEII